MKILLVAVNAKYIHSNPAVYDLKAYAEGFMCKKSPFSKSSPAKKFENESSPFSIEIAEYTINSRVSFCLADIYKRQPDVIAFSCYIWNWTFVKSILSDIKKILPDAAVWLGGPEVSFHAEKVLEEFPIVEGIMLGEGEKTFAGLCGFYVAQEENSRCSDTSLAMHGNQGATVPDQIRGLCIRKAEKPFFTGPQTFIDLDDIPFWYKDLSTFKNRIIYYESSRGCPFCCSYCLSSVDKALRYRKLDLVKRELQFFLDNNVPQVKFIDRTFNCNHSRTEEIWEYITAHDNGITNFHFEIAADLITDYEIFLLSKMRPGLVQLEIGVQSSNSETLSAVSRKTDLVLLQNVVKKIRQGGNVHIHLDLIAGLPFEDLLSFKNSFNFVFSMAPDQLQLGFLKVLKGAPIEGMADNFCISYSEEPPYEVISTKWLSYADILKLKAIEEVLEIFYNSGQFTNTAKYMLKSFASPFDLFECLADFFEENGFNINSPSRMDRFNILLDFALKFDAVNLDIYKELLTFDAYLRENCKSRPGFSRDLKEFNSVIFPIQKGRGVHVDVFSYSVWHEKIIKLEKPAFVEFDYGDRSPLNNNCRTKLVLIL